jgi:TATA-box binding protein (TBP) (component of TFIID and TFIIIB)
MIKKVGTPDVKLKDIEIQNIVSSCNVNFAISLKDLNANHSRYCTY